MNLSFSKSGEIGINAKALSLCTDSVQAFAGISSLNDVIQPAHLPSRFPCCVISKGDIPSHSIEVEKVRIEAAHWPIFV